MTLQQLCDAAVGIWTKTPQDCSIQPPVKALPQQNQGSSVSTAMSKPVLGTSPTGHMFYSLKHYEEDES